MQRASDITFVTYSGLAKLDADDLLAFRLLEQRGFRCQTAVWNDPTVEWNDAGLCVLRSTWDYHLHTDQFFSWLQQVKSRLVNSTELVLWNSNKRYLLDLEARGINIVPTFAITDSADLQHVVENDCGNRAGALHSLENDCGTHPRRGGLHPPAAHKQSIENLFEEHLERAKNRFIADWTKIIIKPAIGLATFGVKLFSLPDQRSEAQQHLSNVLKDSDAIVQAYMPAVSDYGERALVFFDGNYSHAVRKEPFQRLAVAGRAGETKVEPTQAELAFGYKVISALPEVPLYARIDVIPDSNGQTALMELELIEPSLFLAFHPDAPIHFADSIERRHHVFSMACEFHNR